MQETTMAEKPVPCNAIRMYRVVVVKRCDMKGRKKKREKQTTRITHPEKKEPRANPLSLKTPINGLKQTREMEEVAKNQP